MTIEQIYTGCLAQGAYYVESNGEAAIIDPLRETEPYIKRAAKDNAKIKYIFETHFHADFVSGHVDLASKTGATIVFGPNAVTGYDTHVAKDEETFKVGNLAIKVLHTPGHTMESTTFLLIDENGKDHCIFSGDTLFIGDVGRPDLAVKSDLTKEDLARHLYASLRNKIMPLADDVIVYPAHGAGSACGKNMSSETFDSLGNQKATNYALRADMSEEEFVKEVTYGILPPPQYFPKNVMLNKNGYASLDEVKNEGLKPLSPKEFEFLVNDQGALMIDTRDKVDFEKAHIPNSIFIGLNGSFASWVGTLVTDINQPIVFIADKGTEDEVVTRLSRVGYDNTLGFLDGGIDAWNEAGYDVEEIKSVTVAELETLLNNEEITVVDVRKPTEYAAEHVEGAKNVALDYLSENLSEIDKNETNYLHCVSGYRSLIAASILQSRGYNVINIEGGFNAIVESSIKTTDYVCPSTLK
jgi:glyoxylase-like metal-dependent hydrolase (beta-lactamase superfamily II)/rhodanese-related sulfurtransferase